VLRAQEALSTTVVGLTLRGVKPNEKLTLPDLDILLVEDSIRYVPLLHLLRELGVTATNSGDSTVVALGPRTRFAIDPRSQVVQSGTNAPRDLDLHYGVSDVTGMHDIFLREPDIFELLNIQLEWDEQTYGYWGTTRATFPAWARQDDRKKRTGAKRARIGLDLPLVETSGPARNGDPSLHFLQIGGRVAVTNADYVRSQRLLNAYGRLAGGRYVARLRQTTNELSEQPTLERLSLTHRMGDLETTLGDVALSLSDLTFPGGTAFGALATGHFGLTESERDEDRTDFGRLENFSNNEHIRGTAPVGSKVELQINDIWAAETEIMEEAWPGSGYGAYEFKDVTVTRDRISDLRVIITAPDGLVTERTIRPVGTNALMGRGHVAATAIGGQRRFVTGEFFNPQGKFGAGRVLLGVTPYLTLGGVAAYQDRYSFISDLDDSTAMASATFPPRESEHAAGLVRLRLFRKNLLTADVAGSRSKFDNALLRDSTISAPPYETVDWNDPAYALRASLETYWGSFLKLTPHLFYYDPNYFNGVNVELADRRAYAIQSRLELSSQFRINLTHGEIENDLAGERPAQVRQMWDHVDVPLPRMGAGLGIRTAFDRLQTRATYKADTLAATSSDKYIGTADITGSLRIVDVQATISAGDELQPRQDEDLLRGFQLPNSTTSTRPGWTAQLSRKLLKDGFLSVSHSKVDFRELTRISHILRASDRNHWVWRVDAGYDWQQATWTAQAQPEYFFDRNGSTKINALVRYLNNEWVWQVGIRFEPTLSFVGGRPLVIPYSKVNPGNGGIKGQVYVDQNGNGLRERGEPGVAGVEVVSDVGRRAVSGAHGEFLIAGSAQRRRTRVALDPKKLPIEFTAMGGQQWINLEPGNLAPAQLSVARFGYIAGFVYRPDPNDTSKWLAIGAVRVLAKDIDGEVRQESVTLDDGSFYLGELRPGDYLLELDGASIPRACQTLPPGGIVSVRDDAGTGLEVEGIVIRIACPPRPAAGE
jgi:hypothetical protein